MFVSSTPVVVVVKAYDDLSSIAASNFGVDGGLSWEAIYQDNRSVIGPNPNLILVGERLTLGGSSENTDETPTPTQPSSTPSYNSQVSPSNVPSNVPTSDTGGLSDIPGVPQSFAACVAYRESTDLENPAADGNAYGIIPASGYNVTGDSIGQQKTVFAELYRQYGGVPWKADGCPGT